MNTIGTELKELLTALIECPSVTPDDAHCQDILINFLSKLGFRCQRFDYPPVSNFYAEYGAGDPLFLFAGHTDVVSPGDLSLWKTPAFGLTEIDGQLFGRGVADMKGSLAAMLIATKRWIKNTAEGKGRLAFLITSGEEGDDYALGTPYVMSELAKQGIKPSYCLVGEPSSTERVGDMIKIGRRGSLNGTAILQGKQGHVAYPHLADNPIHKLAPVLAELSAKIWDQGNEHFPPTSLQITQIQAGGSARNIIPQSIQLSFNIRYSTEHSAESLQQAVLACFQRHGLNPELDWQLSGKPFLTSSGRLLTLCKEVIEAHTQLSPILSTTGGTSDGRFIS